MPRTRQIKYEFFLNEELAGLPAITRLLFIGLWTLADREGRLEDRPARIRAMLFPYNTDADVNGMIMELAAYRHVSRYKTDSHGSVIEVLKFKKHQKVHPDEKQSVFPPCREIPLENTGPNEIMPLPSFTSLPSCSLPSLNGVSPEPQAATVPPLLTFPVVGGSGKSWGLSEEAVISLREAFPGVDVLAEARKAKAWLDANPGRRKTPRGMGKFLFGWVERTQNRGSYGASGQNRGGGVGGSKIVGHAAPVAGKYDDL